MEFLKIRNSSRQVRADGSPFAVPFFVTKHDRYSGDASEAPISVKRDIMVTGAHDSSKTRWLTRLHDQSGKIWTKSKSPAIWLGALRPLGAWSDQKSLMDWWGEKVTADPANCEPWVKIPAWKRQELIPDYLKDTGAVLFVDDAHKLSGRKLQLARMCVMNAKICVVSATEEQRIAPNLRSALLKRDPQIFRLDSEVAYDATKPLVWLIALIALGAGWWEISLVLGGMQALAGGRRSSKQD
ncbi:MAG: hypothetical protein BWK73_52680 [Thiothrix lacustris]|uniref:Uncharacterized protein n=1 Tax=Thiothrix lacustris TaxID=525917 RepID=A0A1Y1Q7D2_9GAMM|nr:MAG: hypothetical protein BWK73_52680 [Thiothrix lacustris]